MNINGTNSKEVRNDPRGGYAAVDGLSMYYEVHGIGEPLVLLHGGFMTIDAFGPLLPSLAQFRQVIAIELEGHGRTADLDRPLSVEQMAEDVVVLLDQIGIRRADFFGFSMGGMVSLRIAIRHAERVSRLVAVSTPYNIEGYLPSVVAGWPGMTPEVLAGTPMEQVYAQTAPDPDHWPVFVAKMRASLMSFKGWPDSDIQSIQSPTFIILGDADLIRLEHGVRMFRLLAGEKIEAGMGELPKSQLAVLPGTSHFSILYRLDLLLPVIMPFLGVPVPEAS